MNSQQIANGKWWKFDRYEVRNGFICAAEGAELNSYNPWDMYAQTQRTTRKEPPYQSLLQLLSALGSDSSLNPLFAVGVDSSAEYECALTASRCWDDSYKDWFEDQLVAQMSVEYDHYMYSLNGLDRVLEQLQDVIPRAGLGLVPLMVRGNFYEPDPTGLVKLRRLSPLRPKTEERIAAWCSEYGLLGILPHITESVTLSAQWTLGEAYNPERQFMAQSAEHYRINGQWLSRPIRCSFREDANLGTPHEGDFVPASGAYTPRCPGARTRHIEKYGVERPGLSEEDLGETWCDFFPSIIGNERSIPLSKTLNRRILANLCGALGGVPALRADFPTCCKIRHSYTRDITRTDWGKSGPQR